MEREYTCLIRDDHVTYFLFAFTVIVYCIPIVTIYGFLVSIPPMYKYKYLKSSIQQQRPDPIRE